jgi:hypothetical protein
MLPHAYFFLGAHHHVSGDGALAKRYFERSAATAVSLEFPYLASRTLAGI